MLDGAAEVGLWPDQSTAAIEYTVPGSTAVTIHSA